MKVTRVTQPQSSCPFKSARQKIYGLGYALLVFVYDKVDDLDTQTGGLHILHTTFLTQIGYCDGELIANIALYRHWQHLGIKK
jgi:hypothetical protein